MKTTHRRHRFSTAIATTLLLAAVMSLSPATSAFADTGQVRYVMTSDRPYQAKISYRVAPPVSGVGGGGQGEDVFLGPDSPWETTVTLENPYRFANVSVTNLPLDDLRPKFRCEIWIDGKLAATGVAYCSARGH